MADIDLKDIANFTPIGNNSDNKFQGTFDGGGYTISNLTVNKDEYDSFAGLFGYVGAFLRVGGTIKNVNLINATVNCYQDVGGLAGNLSSGTISNCTVSGTVTGNTMVGGLTGSSSGGTISNCAFTGTITGTNDVGGLTGSSQLISGTNVVNATIIIDGNGGSVGGLVGMASGTTSGTFRGEISGANTVNVTISPTSSATFIRRVGGLVGLNESNGKFTGTNYYHSNLDSGGIGIRVYSADVSGITISFDNPITIGDKNFYEADSALTVTIDDGVAVKGVTNGIYTVTDHDLEEDVYFEVTPPAGYVIDSGNDEYNGFYRGEVTFKPKAGYLGENITRTISEPNQVLEGGTLTLDTENRYVFQNADETYSLATAQNIAENNYPDLTKVYTVTVPEDMTVQGTDTYTIGGTIYCKSGSTITVAENEYTVNSDMTFIKEVEAAGWIFNDSVASYKASTTTISYTLGDNEIHHVSSSGGETLLTVSGVKSLGGLSLNSTTVTVGNAALNQETVTISDGYNLALSDDVNRSSTSDATWTLIDSTATYKSATTSAGYSLADNQINYVPSSGGETLLTVNGVKSTDGLSLNGSTVTVGNESLNQETVTISDGYTLALSDEVNRSSTSDATWTLIDSTATYKSATTSAGYSLADNQINYNPSSSGETLVTVSGVKSLDGLSLNGTTVTVGNESLNQETVTISDGYTLALSDEVNRSTTSDATWSFDNNEAAYIDEETSEGYSVIDNQIVYSEEVIGSPLIILSGTAKNASLPTPADKVVTLDSTVLGANSSLKSNDGEYAIELTGDMNEKTFTGSDANDTFKIAADNASVNGGAGNDSFYADGSEVTLTGGKDNDFFKLSGKNPTLTYSVGEGNDTVNFVDGMQISLRGNTSIKALEKTGADLVLGFGENSSIKITGVNFTDTLKVVNDNSSVTLYADKFDLVAQLIFNSDNSSVKVAENFTGSLAPSDDIYLGGSKLSNVSTIDAGNVTNEITVSGNDKDNIIIGGENNDNIFGGDGSDFIIGNAGNDKLYGEAGNDTLSAGAGNDTFRGGLGNDIFICEEGNDVIEDFTEGEDIIELADGKISNASLSGTDVVFTIGTGSLIVKNAADKLTGLMDSFKFSPDISFELGEDVFNSKESVSVTGTAGNNAIWNYGNSVTILGGNGNDSINNYASNVTILSGKGDDQISLSSDSQNNFIRYSSGDGFDTILGFSENDTLNILGDSYQTIKSGNDVIVLVFGKDVNAAR